MAQGMATVEDIELMKKTVGSSMEVKGSTGIKTRADADRLIKAGATRLGTSSGMDIVRGTSSKAAAASNY